MKTKLSKTMLLFVGLLVAAVFATAGCKKESEPAAPVEPNKAVSQVIEQKICPVMGGAINKDLYTEYKGKKVYFCCEGCKEKFEKSPEEYIAKLPQFKQ